jgi:branched-chain amino acid transport system substrate-binding protein
VIALAVTLACTAGCGNRLPDDAFTDHAFIDHPDAPQQPRGTAPTAPGATGAAVHLAESAPVLSARSAAPSPVSASRETGSKNASAAVVSNGGAGAAPAAAGAEMSCPTALSPVLLGQTGAFSGVVGSQHGGIRDGLALWLQAVNAKGGLQCHPVKLYTLDDGSDPGRAAANWNDLVQNKHVVAVVGTSEPLTTATYRSAAERDRVPIIGGDGVSPDFWASPYMFPQGGEALASYDLAERYAAKAKPGTTKIGLVYCVEASICTAQKNNFAAATKAMGYQVGPVQAVSLTQTDYTSECQVMKNADVKTVWIMVDGSAIGRFLRSCAALGYHPTGVTGATAIGNPASADNPQLRANGIYLGAQVAPFIANDTPGLRAWHEALQRFAPDLRAGHATMLGWTSGKLVEAALARVATQARAGDVTTALVLDGLWSLKNETLDGLSPGVTFIKGKASPPKRCSFILGIGTDGWVSPTGSRAECL